MKVLLFLSSVLSAVAAQTSILALPGLDVWRTALQAHAAAEGRLSGIAPVPQPHPFQGHAPPPPTHGRNVPGLSQWQVHQRTVLDAERRLEQQLEKTTITPPPPPSFKPGSKDDSRRIQTDEDYKESLAEFISEVQEERKNGGRNDSEDDDSVSSSSRENQGQSFLDKLLDTYGPPGEENDDARQSSSKSANEARKKSSSNSNKSLSEILGLKKNKKSSRRNQSKQSSRKKSKPRRKEGKEEAVNENILILQEFLNDRKPERRTKTTERPRSRSSDINDVLKSSETDDLLTSLLSAFSSEKEEEQERRQKPSRRDQNKLNKEIQQFLVLLEQVEADILNEVEDDNTPRTKSKKNKSRRKEGGSRRRKTGGRGSEEGARRRQEGGLGRSGFLDEELRLAAEESEILNEELEELMEELEAEKEKQLRFAEETFQIINNRINSGVTSDQLKQDREFVDSVFHRFATLGHPLREEDISIQALQEAMASVTVNVLKAAEESKRIARQLAEEIRDSRRGSRRSSRRRGRQGRTSHFFKDMKNIRRNLKSALKTVQL